MHLWYAKLLLANQPAEGSWKSSTGAGNAAPHRTTALTAKSPTVPDVEKNASRIRVLQRNPKTRKKGSPPWNWLRRNRQSCHYQTATKNNHLENKPSRIRNLANTSAVSREAQAPNQFSTINSQIAEGSIWNFRRNNYKRTVFFDSRTEKGKQEPVVGQVP